MFVFPVLSQQPPHGGCVPAGTALVRSERAAVVVLCVGAAAVAGHVLGFANRLLPVSTRLRDQQLMQLCDVLAAVDPTAPTLCQGWDAHDLAVHIWILKRDPLSWPGMVIPALARTARSRAEHLKLRWSYSALIHKLRQGPSSIACMPFDGWEGHRHALGEYYIHTEDVRRSNDLPHRAPTADTEAALWLRAQRAGRQLWGRGRRAVQFNAAGNAPFVLGQGTPTAHVHGLPSEVILWIYGRDGVADVDVAQ